jgi:hypothetical protein
MLDGPKTGPILPPNPAAPASFVVESLKIFFVCIAAIPYGVIHDQFNVRTAMNTLQSFIGLGRLGAVAPKALPKRPWTGVLFIRQSR